MLTDSMLGETEAGLWPGCRPTGEEGPVWGEEAKSGLGSVRGRRKKRCSGKGLEKDPRG